MYEVFGEENFSLLKGFQENKDLDTIAAYFTNDRLGYPAGFIIIKNKNIEDWVLIHELSHSLENSLFDFDFEVKCKQVIEKLNENIYRDVDYKYSERLADLIVENINNNKIKEIRKCLLEAIKD